MIGIAQPAKEKRLHLEPAGAQIQEQILCLSPSVSYGDLFRMGAIDSKKGNTSRSWLSASWKIHFLALMKKPRPDNSLTSSTSSRWIYWWWKRCELVREEVSLRREMQRRPEHSFHFSIASLLFSSHRDWACCLLPSVSQPSPSGLSFQLPFARAKGMEEEVEREQEALKKETGARRPEKKEKKETDVGLRNRKVIVEGNAKRSARC